MITEILTWLPPKAAIRCLCVYKVWIKLLSDADFVNLHLSRSPPPNHLIVLNLSGPSDSPIFKLVQLEDEINHPVVRRIAPMDTEKIRWSRLRRGMNMIDSINGLICIEECGIRQESFKVWKPIQSIHVWNSIMREYITIQTLGGYEQHPNIITSYGFGISSSGYYRLVMISEETEIANPLTTYIHRPVRVLDSTCHVYTIGAGCKCIGPAPHLHICRHRRSRRRPELGIFLNGNIHWLTNDDDHPEQICCFNLDTELFQPFPPLPKTRPRVTLNIYKGCLSVVDNDPYEDTVIWVMKEYGLQTSWSHRLVGYYEDVYILKVFKDGEVLLQWRDGSNCAAYSYHPHRKTMQVIDIKETMSGPSVTYIPYIQVKEYVPSIVSLKSLGEVNVNRI